MQHGVEIKTIKTKNKTISDLYIDQFETYFCSESLKKNSKKILLVATRKLAFYISSKSADTLQQE